MDRRTDARLLLGPVAPAAAGVGAVAGTWIFGPVGDCLDFGCRLGRPWFEVGSTEAGTKLGASPCKLEFAPATGRVRSVFSGGGSMFRPPSLASLGGP